MKKILSGVALLFSLVVFQGCGPTVVVRDRPVSSYARPLSPRPGYIWIEGDWYGSGGRYVQRPGYWAAPRPNRAYRPGTWNQRGNRGWHYRKGGWRRN